MDLLWADMNNYGIRPLLGCVTRLHSMIYPHDAKVSDSYIVPLFIDEFAEHLITGILF
jgi:hypothetical protein